MKVEGRGGVLIAVKEGKTSVVTRGSTRLTPSCARLQMLRVFVRQADK